MSMDEFPTHLTINQAAEYLGVSRHKIRRLIKGAKLSSVEDWYDGRCQLINIEELDRLRERVRRGRSNVFPHIGNSPPN